MIKNRKNTILCGLTALILCFAGAVSCTDADDHYKVAEEVEGRVSLWELISQQPDLSTFASLLERYSYNRILSGDQVYTVWAPSNEYLQGISPDDSMAVVRMITTHIARYSYPASGAVSAYPDIYMLSAKKQPFLVSGNTCTIGGVELRKGSLAAKNGILHVLNGKIPFFPNIWQIMEEERYDSIRTYLYAFNKREFLRNMSQQIDINDEGMIVYDSVFIEQNSMWYTYRGAKGVGYLNNEDSVYTMILPDNAAWTEAYNRYYPLFRPDPSLPNRDSMQRANTQYSIVQDLVFRGAITNPGVYGENDSILSTRGAIIRNPAHIFSGASPVRTSNGWIYSASSLQYGLTDSYAKSIKIEAEMPLGRMHDETRDMGTYQQWYVRDNSAVSGNMFLLVKDLGKSSSETPLISFEIPGVVNTGYDIYAVFLAHSFVEPLSTDTNSVTRVKFEIQQWNRLGSKTDDRNWGDGKNWGPGRVLATFSGSGPEFVTEKRGISVIKAATNYVFPFANINEDDYVFRIRVISSLSRTDLNSKDPKFNKEMRIDYLLLVPSTSN
jgi:uncharacterized surface protein with fasciclin (FAS1) repeats